MGGCCCCANRDPEPPFYPSAENAVDTNLDTSDPDTYRAPPMPIPYDNVVSGRPVSSQASQETCADKNGGGGGADQTTNSDSIQEAGGGDVPEESSGGGSHDVPEESSGIGGDDGQDPPAKSSDDVKESDQCKKEAKKSEIEQVMEESEVETEKPGVSGVKSSEEEDACPICLDEYDEDNPKYLTNCVHHFHFACILEWNERSENCPVCDKVVTFDHLDGASRSTDAA